MDAVAVPDRVGTIEVVVVDAGQAQPAFEEGRLVRPAARGDGDAGQFGHVLAEFPRGEPSHAKLAQVLVDPEEHGHFRIADDGNSGHGHVRGRLDRPLDRKGLRRFLAFPCLPVAHAQPDPRILFVAHVELPVGDRQLGTRHLADVFPQLFRRKQEGAAHLGREEQMAARLPVLDQPGSICRGWRGVNGTTVPQKEKCR